MKRFGLLLAAGLATTALLAGAAPGGDAEDGDHRRSHGWTVRVTNLTEGQPLSPPLLVVHTRRTDVWGVGEIASHGVAAIAEDANNAVLESALPQLDGVAAVTTGAGGPIPPGATHEYAVAASGPFAELTLLTMLVNTNDAFTGLDGFRLRDRSRTVETMAYDAGSEENNELAAFIPGPCCGSPFVRAPEGELVRHHPGIAGTGDLDPATYGWEGPVARIEIRRD